MIYSIGTVNSSPAYGYEVNQMFLDVIHDHDLDQLVTEATRGNNILDLILCSHPHIISDINIIPGISNHEALLFCLGSPTKPVIDEINRSIFLFHKGDMASLKGDILEFQRQFLSSSPYSSSVEDNWSNFKSALSDAMIKHIPEKICKSTNHLPWLTHSIRKLINQRKHLYKQAKRLQTEEAWSKYRKLRNEITSGIRSAHCNYQNGLFTQNEGINHKNFWKYIEHIRKDQFGVAPLNVDDTCINNSKDKAESLNKQFQSVFTSENLSHMPDCNGLSSSTMPNIIISIEGVQNLLESLDVAKAPGPDGIPTRILKLCAAEIAPILTVIFVQSLAVVKFLRIG